MCWEVQKISIPFFNVSSVKNSLHYTTLLSTDNRNIALYAKTYIHFCSMKNYLLVIIFKVLLQRITAKVLNHITESPDS